MVQVFRVGGDASLYCPALLFEHDANRRDVDNGQDTFQMFSSCLIVAIGERSVSAMIPSVNTTADISTKSLYFSMKLSISRCSIYFIICPNFLPDDKVNHSYSLKKFALSSDASNL